VSVGRSGGVGVDEEGNGDPDGAAKHRGVFDIDRASRAAAAAAFP
jgi:hypothetical protein